MQRMLRHDCIGIDCSGVHDHLTRLASIQGKLAREEHGDRVFLRSYVTCLTERTFMAAYIKASTSILAELSVSHTSLAAPLPCASLGSLSFMVMYPLNTSFITSDARSTSAEETRSFSTPCVYLRSSVSKKENVGLEHEETL